MKLTEKFLLFIKCVIIGIASFIPGSNLASFAFSFEIYEMFIEATANFFNNFKASFNILLPIIVGLSAGLLTGNRLITYILERWQVQTIMLCIGLMFGGISLFVAKVKNNIKIINILSLIIVFMGILCLNFYLPSAKTVTDTNIFVLFLIGGLSAIVFLLPGLPSNFVLIISGYYDKVINAFDNVGSNLLIIIPFVFGCFVLIILVTKLLLFLIKKYKEQTYYIILGLVSASVVILILKIRPFKHTFVNMFTSILTFLWGYLLARKMAEE